MGLYVRAQLNIGLSTHIFPNPCSVDSIQAVLETALHVFVAGSASFIFDYFNVMVFLP